MIDKFEKIRQILENALSVGVLTGAGISAESGVSTYRDSGGLWENFAANDYSSPEGFRKNPEKVWQWYGERRREMLNARPNPGHFALAELEKNSPKFLLITQNIDNLHRRAGNRTIAEIHGNIFRNRCTRCGHTELDETYDFSGGGFPVCRKCGSPARVDVVWFGESLPEKELVASLMFTEKCDVFISVGTSAKVYPAASFPEIAKNHGAIFIEVNLEPTHLTRRADFSFIGKSGEILPRLIGNSG